ncbi:MULTISPECIES: hypothetical protein [unclassified Saccharothrix]|uniref:hypothetical protein n=1 Tax=unclassified Saccharothrix TaxID=2593673 RepID=UPI00307D2F50
MRTAPVPADPGGEWKEVRIPGGPSVPVRKGSPIDAVFGEAAPKSSPQRMPWSLGSLGDHLWLRLEEARPRLAELVHEELDRAIEEHRPLRPLDPFTIASDVVRYGLLEPAFARYPESAEQLARYLSVVREGYTEDEPGGYMRHALGSYVLDWLAAPQYLPMVEQLDRALHDILIAEFMD